VIGDGLAKRAVKLLVERSWGLFTQAADQLGERHRQHNPLIHRPVPRRATTICMVRLCHDTEPFAYQNLNGIKFMPVWACIGDVSCDNLVSNPSGALKRV
jgi:hypothetical protein